MEIEGPHQHHPHGTGSRWLDITLALCAFVISVVSLYLSIHSAQMMEKLVTANSYPHVDIVFSNIFELQDGTGTAKPAIRMGIESSGVGPARIEWITFSYKGKPMASVEQLIEACCAGVKGNTNGMLQSSGFGDLLQPGKTMRSVDWKATAEPNPLWDKLYNSMNDIGMETCYCSVFDDCFVRSRNVSRPKPVKLCSMPAVLQRQSSK